MAVCGCAGRNAALFSRVGEVMDSTVRAGIVPGAVVCVVKDGKVVFMNAYGNKQVEPVSGQDADMALPVPMTTDVLFDMASCTKVVGTTTAVMQLYEQGLFDLDDRIEKYLPEFAGDELTIRDLLTHASGLPSYNDYVDFDKYEAYGAAARDSLTMFFAKSCPREARGTYIYSCVNFYLLQEIVQRLTGERLCDYVTEHVFKPLGMDDTHYFTVGEPIAPEIHARIAPVTVILPIGAVHDPLARRMGRGNSGNAGMFSTAADLAKFCSAILNGGEYKGARILRQDTVEKMMQVADPKSGRALGWDVCSSAAVFQKGDNVSPDSIMHTGYTGPVIVMDPHRKLAIIVLANRVHPKDANTVEWSAARRERCNILGQID